MDALIQMWSRLIYVPLIYSDVTQTLILKLINSVKLCLTENQIAYQLVDEYHNLKEVSIWKPLCHIVSLLVTNTLDHYKVLDSSHCISFTRSSGPKRVTR